MSTSYSDIAGALRDIADRIEGAAGPARIFTTTLMIQPYPFASDEDKTSAVDGVAEALFGHPGEQDQLSDGVCHHSAAGKMGSIWVRVFARVASPAEREVQALRQEVERLRAQVAEPEQAQSEPEGGAPDA